MRSAMEAATSSALSLLQLGEAADAFGVSPIIGRALIRPSMDSPSRWLVVKRPVHGTVRRL